ncbi:MAG: cytochrome P450 [bacterium]|nr:cytochrome P450 [bacterium]
MTSVTPLKDLPCADQTVGLKALQGIRRRRSIIGALEVLHREMGDVFRLIVPGFNPVMLVGPEAARFVLVTSRNDFRWRIDNEPITILLRHGVLVEDDDSHDQIRRAMHPALHKNMLAGYTESMWRCTDQVTQTWQPGQTLDMLVEMRKVALLILTDTLFGVDFSPDLKRLWTGVLRAVQYISPGPWVLWRGFSHLGYNRHLRQVDAYLDQVVALRRSSPALGSPDDLIGVLMAAGMSNDLIRDQLMTMLIAGHDTSTASLAWALYLLGAHPDILQQTAAEVRAVLGAQPPAYDHLPQLTLLDQVIDEVLRLYPPIHLGSRVAATDLAFNGYRIPAGMRVLYSIYLTQRHPAYWPEPERFIPARFAKGEKHVPYSYLPFGGGPRNCVGAAFAGVETKVVLARLLQQFDFTLMRDDVHPHMGATLEPRPGVFIQVK